MEEEGLIARNVRTRMEAKDLGPKALSLKAGLNETYVRDILKGRSHNPRQSHLQRLAKALECRVSDLTGEGHADVTMADPVRKDLLAAYDGLDEEQRQALLTMAKLMVRGPTPVDASPPTKPQLTAIDPADCDTPATVRTARGRR